MGQRYRKMMKNFILQKQGERKDSIEDPVIRKKQAKEKKKRSKKALKSTH